MIGENHEILNSLHEDVEGFVVVLHVGREALKLRAVLWHHDLREQHQGFGHSTC